MKFNPNYCRMNIQLRKDHFIALLIYANDYIVPKMTFISINSKRDTYTHTHMTQQHSYRHIVCTKTFLKITFPME